MTVELCNQCAGEFEHVIVETIVPVLRCRDCGREVQTTALPLDGTPPHAAEGVHSCHAECPCHRGAKPAPDFEEDDLELAAIRLFAFSRGLAADVWPDLDERVRARYRAAARQRPEAERA